jgi:hypothetical protein
VHLYYSFIQFLVIFCSEYMEAYNVILLDFAEAQLRYHTRFFLKLYYDVKGCLVGSLTGVVAS